MICALVVQGKRVGVLGPSHKVIANLLAEVLNAARHTSTKVRIAQKVSGDATDPVPVGITPISTCHGRPIYALLVRITADTSK
jgi:hypothetical protein